MNNLERGRLALAGLLGVLEELVEKAVGKEMLGWLDGVPGLKELAMKWEGLRVRVQEVRFSLPVQQQQLAGGMPVDYDRIVVQDGMRAASVADETAKVTAEEVAGIFEG
jgi:hypothetical protein